MTRPSLSAILICKDNESYIQKCIESISWADEIIAVDSGSKDGTVGILKEGGAKVFFREWEGYRKQKEYAMGLASHDWILEIDSDEFLSPELREEIQSIPPQFWDTLSCFEIPRLTFFLGKPITHSGWYPDHKPRLYDRRKGRWVGTYVHEHFETEGRKAKLSGNLFHSPPWDTRSFLQRTIDYSILNAKEYRERGRKGSFLDLAGRPFYTFFYRFFLRKGFMDGSRGLLICAAESFGVFLKYFLLRYGGEIK